MTALEVCTILCVFLFPLISTEIYRQLRIMELCDYVHT